MHFSVMPISLAFRRALRQLGALLALLALFLVVTSAPAAAQSTPTGLTATADSHQVALSWSASSFPTAYPTFESFYAAFYRVYRSTTPGGENGHQIAEIDDPDPDDDDPPAPDTTYTDTNVTPGTTYYYTVTAVLETTSHGGHPGGENTGPQVSESAMSNEASATVAVGQAAPANLAAMSAPGGGSLYLSWQSVGGATSYNLSRGTAAGGETLYKNGLAATTYTDTDVMPGTTYYYTVTAVGANGESPPSNEAHATAQVVTTPDFTLSVNPSVNIPIGTSGNRSTASLAVNVAAVNNFIGTVTFSISGLPTGVTAAFSPPGATGSGGTTLLLSINPDNPNAAAIGSTTLTVTGTSGNLVHSKTLTLNIMSNGGNGTGGPILLTDLYLPNTLRLEWASGHHDLNLYRVVRSGPRSDGGIISQDNGVIIWEDHNFAFGTAYTYQVFDDWQDGNDPNNGQPGTAATTGTDTIGIITVTPMQALVTENQVVDARYDPRFSTWTFANHNFGAATYRGGLFAGYNEDNSQVGHSYLKFLLPPPAAGLTVLPVASVNAWFTRNYDLTKFPYPYSVGVGCRSVPSYWDAASITWATAPAFSPSQTPQILPADSQNTSWVHWNVGIDFASAFGTGGGPYSVALSGIQEPAVGGIGPSKVDASGWAYFAKKEYGSGQPATLLYVLQGTASAPHVLNGPGTAAAASSSGAHAAPPASRLPAKKPQSHGGKKP